ESAGEDEFADMEKLEKLTGVAIPKNLSDLRSRAVRHTTVLDVDEMLDFVLAKAQQKKWF
ncbi:MAG: threonine synthase, partial [Oscillospiraceae bacterium]|nr:threonine synthase [Oscillospiraceae bacterium]